MQMTLIYIHGQYGSPEEAEHYRPLLPGCEVMPGGEHWFHTPEQMAFLDGWIQRARPR